MNHFDLFGYGLGAEHLLFRVICFRRAGCIGTLDCDAGLEFGQVDRLGG